MKNCAILQKVEFFFDKQRKKITKNKKQEYSIRFNFPFVFQCNVFVKM